MRMESGANVAKVKRKINKSDGYLPGINEAQTNRFFNVMFFLWSLIQS